MMAAMASLQAQIFDMLQHSQYWPVAKLRAYQESQLAQLIAHARKEVPFYERRLDILFDHSGAIDWSRWPEVPVLTRAELRDHGEEICARHLPQGHGVVRDAATSGSTGVPVRLRQNDLYKQATLTAGSRFAQWAGVLPDMTFASLAPHFPDHLPPDVNVHPLPIRDPAIRGSGRRLLLRRTLPAPALLDVIAAEGVQALGGNVVLLEILARENLKRARADFSRSDGADGAFFCTVVVAAENVEAYAAEREANGSGNAEIMVMIAEDAVSKVVVLDFVERETCTAATTSPTEAGSHACWRM